VWFGTYKLRINLARFGREENNGPAKKKHLTGGVITSEAKRIEGKSFSAAVTGDTSGLRNKAVKGKSPEYGNTVVERAIVDAHSSLFMEPEMNFMGVLECSFVGKLVKGGNVKNIQLNLCLEGIRGVQAANMGDGRVLLFSETGEDVGVAINRRVWWEGLLTDLKPWDPCLV
jgi:hypothetical protein